MRLARPYRTDPEQHPGADPPRTRARPRGFGPGVVALSLASLVGACSVAPAVDPPAVDPPAVNPPVDAPPTVGAAPQQLAFGSCEGYATTTVDAQLFASEPRARCARLPVPLDHDDPGGATAQIAMLKVPARGPSQGTVVLNSGGPGGAGMSFAVATAAALADSPVTERFDLVGFDPRGVGASTPAVECFTPEQYLAGQARTEFFLSARTWTATDATGLAQQCAERSGGSQNLAHLGSRDTARDMDLLRSALGEPTLRFLGQSYGTRIGTLYASMFPQHVGAMVLDGAVDPQAGDQRRLAQYASFQNSFERMATLCTENPGCALGPDPARATERFQQIVRPLLDRPLRDAQGGAFGYDEAIDAVLGILLSDPTAWRPISIGLTDLQAGDPNRFARVNQAVSGREPDGRGSNMTAANLAIGCLDEQRKTPEQAEQFRARAYAAVPFADPGRGPAGARDACEAWPAAPDPAYPLPERIPGLPPTLTISFTNDPTTPLDGAQRLTRTLAGGLLTVDGDGHTIAATGTNPCVNDAVAAYLLDGRLPGDGARCPAVP